MKKILVSVLALVALSVPAVAGKVKYDADATPAAIAADKAAKKAAVKEGVVPCAMIDTKTGKCVTLLVLDAGGGDS
ncbi:hypothetical protein V1279_003050 [Bradyrhizobium sp. AZCC 1610]|uniref:hypothetical protein n=1 Tax=Bradyrhizobium sp. AZCC 1610 TaxID=3117020 RepID=UPI002FF10D3E